MAADADTDLFVSLDTKDLDRVDLIELVEEDLRQTPSPCSSPIPQISCRSASFTYKAGCQKI